MLRPIALTLIALTLPGAALAGPIERACLSSDRDAASRAVCSCIQSLADQMLDGPDQRRAAKFFRDPGLAHKTMLSDTKRDDAFWERWQSFGSTAELYCAPQPESS